MQSANEIFLREFLCSFARDRQLMEENMELLVPFFSFARLGFYGRAVEVNPMIITRALHTALDARAVRIIGIPVESSFCVSVDDETSFVNAMHARHHETLIRCVGDWCVEKLEWVLDNTLLDDLARVAPEPYQEVITQGVKSALLPFLAYIILKKAGRAAEFVYLISALPCMMPLKEEKKGSGVWQVVLF